MPSKTTKKTQNKTVRKKHTYLREVEIKFKKKRVKAGSPVGEAIADSKQIYQLFQNLQNEAKEKLICISLSTKMKIICFEVVAIGSLHSVYARPVEVIRAAIPLNPHGIILVHNHPSGDPCPSTGDTKFTQKLLRSCHDLGIKFLDHIIIGEDEYFSFADEGMID